MQEENNNIPWEREVIEKLLLKNQNQKKHRKRFWLWVILIIFILLFILPKLFSSSQIGYSLTHIATLKLDSEISDNNDTLDKIHQGLEDIYQNTSNVKAVIIQANSPGGSPVISDTIFQEIRHYKSLYPNIPIYTVIGDLCASGCYYIVSASDKIYANQASIVGSIGVIMIDIDLTELANKFGIKDRTKTAGNNKALGNPLKAETSEQTAIITKMLDDVHQLFINAVKTGRGDRLKWQDDDQIFSGRVYSGTEAKDIGLVDDFGTIYSISRQLMKNPRLVDYTPEDDWYEFARKNLGISLKEMITNTLNSQSLF